jgi:hypothetical protein
MSSTNCFVSTSYLTSVIVLNGILISVSFEDDCHYLNVLVFGYQ